MTTLHPLARALIERSAQSVALQQKHRAHIWAQLQQRIATASIESVPRRWRVSGSALCWIGGASLVLGAGILGGVHRREAPAAAILASPCRDVPTTACTACPSSTSREIQTRAAPPPDSPLGSNQNTAARSKARQRGSRPVARPPSGNARPTRAAPPAHRVAMVLPPHDSFSLENFGDRQIRSDAKFVASNAAITGSPGPFGATPEWLELAPQLVVEGRLEAAQPLKLTPPQFKLTAVQVE